MGFRAGEELAPVALLTVDRTEHRLLGEGGTVLLEVADDRVSAAKMGSAARLSS